MTDDRGKRKTPSKGNKPNSRETRRNIRQGGQHAEDGGTVHNIWAILHPIRVNTPHIWHVHGKVQDQRDARCKRGHGNVEVGPERTQPTGNCMSKLKGRKRIEVTASSPNAIPVYPRIVHADFEKVCKMHR